MDQDGQDVDQGPVEIKEQHTIVGRSAGFAER